MNNAIAFIASQSSPSGGLSLSLSDRGAVALATKTCGAATACCAPGDALAAEYAVATGCVMTRLSDAFDSLTFDQAWIGNGFLEQFGDDFAARLAERHSATLFIDVLSCTTAPNQTKTIVRDAGRGTRHVITTTGPTVLVVSPSVQRPGYVSRYRRLHARKEIDKSHLFGESPLISIKDWQLARPRTRISSRTGEATSLDQRMDTAFGMSAVQEHTTAGPIIADARTCAQYLLRYLVHHGFIKRSSASDLLIVTNDGEQTRLQSAKRDGDHIHAEPPPNRQDHAARRPRSPADPPARLLRQPRLIEFDPGAAIQSPQDRRPRLSGSSRRNHRGPRRIPDLLKLS